MWICIRTMVAVHRNMHEVFLRESSSNGKKDSFRLHMEVIHSPSTLRASHTCCMQQILNFLTPGPISGPHSVPALALIASVAGTVANGYLDGTCQAEQRRKLPLKWSRYSTQEWIHGNCVLVSLSSRPTATMLRGLSDLSIRVPHY